MFKERLIDCFKQTWFSDIENNRVLNSLNIFVKPNFGVEEYIKTISKGNRSLLTRLRISSHNLRIESGRYGRNRVD